MGRIVNRGILETTLWVLRCDPIATGAAHEFCAVPLQKATWRVLADGGILVAQKNTDKRFLLRPKKRCEKTLDLFPSDP